MVSTAAFHARVRGSVPGLGGLKKTKMFLPHPRVKVSIVGSLRDREVACSASDRQGSNFESYVWRTVSSQPGFPGQVYPICAQRWPKARFISFLNVHMIVFSTKVFTCCRLQCSALTHRQYCFSQDAGVFFRVSVVLYSALKKRHNETPRCRQNTYNVGINNLSTCCVVFLT